MAAYQVFIIIIINLYIFMVTAEHRLVLTYKDALSLNNSYIGSLMHSFIIQSLIMICDVNNSLFYEITSEHREDHLIRKPLSSN